jgi:hypothetical protein
MTSRVPSWRALAQGCRGGVRAGQACRRAGGLPNGALSATRRLCGNQGGLAWRGGLVETRGRNGVTSNYRFDLAPYAAELVKEMRGGKALFTQPPMPIKCAGAAEGDVPVVR